MARRIPTALIANCRLSSERSQWLAALPALIDQLEARWSLQLEPPFDNADVSCAWVAPARRNNGSMAVLKIGMPHFEAEHEIAGLKACAGDPTVQLLAADEQSNAMLLERCWPGTSLRGLPEAEQDVVIAGLLRRLWRTPVDAFPFRALSEMTAEWRRGTESAESRWPDGGLVRAGLRLLEELPRTAGTTVLLATDLHAGNVLAAERRPWLVIDPKPYLGDPAYDLTQHLLNCRSRLHSDPTNVIQRFAGLAGVEDERVRLWTFARLAADPRDDWDEDKDDALALARALAP